MNISLTCCASLVGFDWGANPSLRCMNVGWNIHQMLSQKLYPLLSTTHKDAIRAPPVQTKEAQPGVELRPWVYLLFARIISAGLRLCLRVMLCHAGMWIRMGVSTGQSLTSLTSACCIVIACRFLHSLSTLRGPHPLLFAPSKCRCSSFHEPCEEAHRDVFFFFFDACFIIHVLTIQSLRHLPGEGCCSTLLSTHN